MLDACVQQPKAQAETPLPPSGPPHLFQAPLQSLPGQQDKQSFVACYTQGLNLDSSPLSRLALSHSMLHSAACPAGQVMIARALGVEERDIVENVPP